MPQPNRVGSLPVVDLETICGLYGHQYLPYPLGRSRPVGSAWLLLLDESPLEERVTGNDLGLFRDWAEACARADIWVDCRVHVLSEGTPDTRIHAFRAGDTGFLAVQRPDPAFVDIVEISTLSAYDLGAAVADAITLMGPGRHSRVVVPGCATYFGRESLAEAVGTDDDYSAGPLFSVKAGSGPVSDTVVPDNRVAAMATVQTRCDPAGKWGLDTGRDFVAWVQVIDDGDYIYSPDFSRAVPMTAQELRRRIDRQIAEDVQTVRRRRNETD